MGYLDAPENGGTGVQGAVDQALTAAAQVWLLMNVTNMDHEYYDLSCISGCLSGAQSDLGWRCQMQRTAGTPSTSQSGGIMSNMDFTSVELSENTQKVGLDAAHHLEFCAMPTL